MEPLTFIRQDDSLESENRAFGVERPTVVLYVNKDTDYSDQILVLERIAGSPVFDVAVHVLEEELSGLFAQKHMVKGSPTYLLFDSGMEKGRLLGKADDSILVSFLEKYLSRD